jgi:hypothetical protein
VRVPSSCTCNTLHVRNVLRFLASTMRQTYIDPTLYETVGAVGGAGTVGRVGRVAGKGTIGGVDKVGDAIGTIGTVIAVGTVGTELVEEC